MAGEIERGQTAQRLLEDELVKDLFASLEAEYVKNWKEAPTTESRELAWHRMNALGDLQSRLRRLRDSGVRATKEQQ